MTTTDRHPPARRAALALAAMIFACSMVLAACSSASSSGATSSAADTTGTSSASGAGGSKTAHYKIGIAVTAPVALLEGMVTQFKKKIADLGYTNVSYTERNGQGNAQNYSLIVQQLTREKPNLIYALGTPIVTGFLQQQTNIPVIFGAVTDPVGAGFVKSLSHPGGDYTGTSDAVTAKDTFDLIHQLIPKAHRIGIVGNVGEQNTASQIETFKKYAATHGFSIRVAPIRSSADIQLAINSLQGKADVLLVGADDTVVSAIATAGQAAMNAKLPFVLAAGSTPTPGLLVAFGANYPQLGRINAAQAAKILSGTAPGSIPVATPETGGGFTVTVDTKTASRLGVSVPKKLLGMTPHLADK